MTKLFIENANREASASIRIYPLDENSQVIAPDSFTSMDDLGLSFGIALAPKTGIDCTGVVARSGGLPVTEWYNGETSTNFEIKVDGESIGYDFYFDSWDSRGNERIARELLKRGIEIEFMQEIG